MLYDIHVICMDPRKWLLDQVRSCTRHRSCFTKRILRKAWLTETACGSQGRSCRSMGSWTRSGALVPVGVSTVSSSFAAPPSAKTKPLDLCNPPYHFWAARVVAQGDRARNLFVSNFHVSTLGPVVLRSALIISIRKNSNGESQIPEPLLILTSKCPLRAQISQGLARFFPGWARESRPRAPARVFPTRFRRGDDTVGNRHRAQIYEFEFFELILLLKLDKRFPVERFEVAVSQVNSTLPPPLRNVATFGCNFCLAPLTTSYAQNCTV